MNFTDDTEQRIESYVAPFEKSIRGLTDAEVQHWICVLEEDVAAGLTPYNMKDDMVAQAITRGIAHRVSEEEMAWRRANPDRLWLMELLNLHRTRHIQPRLWEKIIRWD